MFSLLNECFDRKDVHKSFGLRFVWVYMCARARVYFLSWNPTGRMAGREQRYD